MPRRLCSLAFVGIMLMAAGPARAARPEIPIIPKQRIPASALCRPK